MRGKKLIKRTLSLIISAMMLVTALPVSSLAAVADDIAAASITADATGKDIVGLKVMAAKDLYLGDGTKATADQHTALLTAYKAGNKDAANKYNFVYGDFAVTDQTTSSADDKKVLDDMAAVANKLFKDECVDGVLEVNQGATFYLALKFDNSRVTTNKGFANIGVGVSFDAGKLTVESTASKIVLNNIVAGVGRDSILEEADPSAWHADYYEYMGDYSISAYNVDTNSGLAVLAANTNENWYMPVKHTTWDVLIPVTVKADATGTAIIGFNKSTTGTGTISFPMSADANGTAGRKSISGSIAAGTVGQVGDNAGETTVEANAIAIKIKSPPKKIGTPTLKEYSADGVPVITLTGVGDTGNVAAATDISWSVDDGETWTAIAAANVSGSDWTVPDAVLTALCAGTTVKITSNTDDPTADGATKTIGTSGADITVTKGTTPTADSITIDYENEQINAASAINGLQYKIGSGSWTDLGTSTNASVASILDAASNPDKFLLHIKGTSSGMPSGEFEVTGLARPTIGAKVTATEDATAKKNGQTKLDTGALPTGTKYVVATSTPAASAFASAEAVPATKLVDARKGSGNHVYLFTPAVANTSFASKVTDAGAAYGNDNGTITNVAFDASAKTVTLTMVGDKFVDGGTISITTPSGADTVTTSSVKKGGTNDSQLVITLSADPTEDKEYTFTVDAGNTAQNKVPALDTGVELKFQKTSKPKITLATSSKASDGTTALTFDKDKFDGTDLTVTVSGLGELDSIDTISSDNNAITVAKVSGNSFKVTGNAPATNGTANITITVKAGKKELSSAVLDTSALGSVLTKTYDGGTTLTLADAQKNATVNTSSNELAASYKGIKITFKDAVFTDKNVGSGNKEVTLKGVAVANTGSDDHAQYYEITGGPDWKVTCGTISAKALSNSSTVTVADAAAGTSDLAGLKTALGNAAVTIDGVSEGKLSDLIDMDNAAVTTAINAALVKAGAVESADVPVSLKDTDPANPVSAASVSYKPGDVLQLDLPDGYTVSAVTPSTGYTVDGANITAAADAAALTKITLEKDGTTHDVTVTSTLGDAVADATKAAGKDVTVELTGATLNTAKKGSLSTNYSDVDQLPNINAKTTMPSGGSGGVSGGSSGVAIPAINDVQSDYGTLSSTEAMVDENGKIIELPVVTNVVKGAVFVGWSKDGTAKGIIDPEKDTLKEGDKLTAIYQGYMVGDEYNNINPHKEVTRAELVKMLVVASGKYDPAKYKGAKSPFTDKSGWYDSYLACAKEMGIADGYTDGSFKPNQSVTREEAAKFIALAFGVPTDKNATVDALTDFDKLQGWSKEYVAALYGTGAIDGFEDHTYRGNRNILRDASAKMINGFLGLDEAGENAIKVDTTITVTLSGMVSKTDWAYSHLVFASLSAPASYYGTEIVIPTRK